MERWSGRVAVVTGASAGIGADLAKKLATEGMKVVGVARRKEKVEELVNQMPKDCKGKLIPYKCDISDETQAKELFEWIEKNHGGISVMVNNAGLARFVSFGGEQDTKGWKEILDTNVYALSLCSRYALHSMRKHNIDDGQFININSVVGHTLPPTQGVSMAMYFASKHAVKILSDGLRKEVASLKTNIRVANVSPGHVNTDFLEAAKAPPPILQIAKVLKGLQAKDVTAAIIFILSTPPKVNICEMIIRPTGDDH